MRLMHFEDSMDKHLEIFRVLRRIENCDILKDSVWTTNFEEGIEEIEKAFMEGNPIDLIITDMHFPMTSKGNVDWKAGEYLINTLNKKGLNIPVIVCSSNNYKMPNAYATIWFSELSDWEIDLIEIIKNFMKGK